MKRQKIGETLTVGKRTVYILNIRISRRYDSLNEGGQFLWGTFPSKKKAIDYIKKNSKKHLRQAYGAGAPNFKSWIINELIEDTGYTKNLNFYDSGGNEICHLGAVLK